MSIQSLLALVAVACLAGCATAPVPTAQKSASSDNSLFRDQAFARADPQRNMAYAHQLFDLSPAMRTFLDREMADPQSSFRLRGAQQGLIDALYARGKLQLDYDASETLDARETFDAKRGNCLSLVLMTAAFAKALGLEVNYQSVSVDETWSRANGMLFAVGHVNLTLGRRASFLGTERRMQDALTIDFFPPEATVGQRATPISESMLVAMYLNNRAAEALAADRTAEAYWWTRAAISHDARFAPAFNTLGVIYRRQGMSDMAEAALMQVLALEPFNAKTLANLAALMREQGRHAEASRFDERAAAFSRFAEYPPFHFLDVGVEQMKLGNFAQARAAFRRELRRDPHNAEAHFWLARAQLQMGDRRGAVEALQQAVEEATTRRSRELYAAKLDYLKTAYRPAPTATQ